MTGSESTTIGSALGGGGSANDGLLGGLGSMFGSATSIGGSEFGGISGGGLFGALGSALSGASKLGSTAFGVVSNVSSSSVGLTVDVDKSTIGSVSNATTLLGGVLDKGMKPAFAFIGNTVAKAGNMLGGVMSMGGDLASASVNKISGKINQSI